MELNKVINERHSARRFTYKKPDYGKILDAIEAANKGPLAGNIPTLKFMLVSEEEKIREIAEAATQDFISTAHYVVVICSNSTNCVKAYGDRGEIYSLQQAGAAIENFLLKITDHKLATCWVGAFSDKTIRRILQIPDDVRVEGIFPIGHEKGKTKQRYKPNLDSCVFFNTWKNHYMKPIIKPDAT